MSTNTVSAIELHPELFCIIIHDFKLGGWHRYYLVWLVMSSQSKTLTYVLNVASIYTKPQLSTNTNNSLTQMQHHISHNKQTKWAKQIKTDTNYKSTSSTCKFDHFWLVDEPYVADGTIVVDILVRRDGPFSSWQNLFLYFVFILSDSCIFFTKIMGTVYTSFLCYFWRFLYSRVFLWFNVSSWIFKRDNFSLIYMHIRLQNYHIHCQNQCVASYSI